uniref:Uncharacterized protein n=1 Tax=Mustela putorius furo TaxID=9669 RepID=M3Z3A5_MUSPF
MSHRHVCHRRPHSAEGPKQPSGGPSGGRERSQVGREAGRERERRKQAPCRAESPMRNSIPGPQDHDLSRRQRLNPLSHPGAPGSHPFLMTDIEPMCTGPSRAWGRRVGRCDSPLHRSWQSCLLHADSVLVPGSWTPSTSLFLVSLPWKRLSSPTARRPSAQDAAQGAVGGQHTDASGVLGSTPVGSDGPAGVPPQRPGPCVSLWAGSASSSSSFLSNLSTQSALAHWTSWFGDSPEPGACDMAARSGFDVTGPEGRPPLASAMNPHAGLTLRGHRGRHLQIWRHDEMEGCSGGSVYVLPK